MCVKVVRDRRRDARSTSRGRPFRSCATPPTPPCATPCIRQHVGVYAYHREALAQWVALAAAPARARSNASSSCGRSPHGLTIGVADVPRRRGWHRYRRRSCPRECALGAAPCRGDTVATADAFHDPEPGKRLMSTNHTATGQATTPKYIFVTGGVVSSLGKGIAAASLGRLLVERGFRVTMMKFDPYLNVDPGTMSPFQHGEVFVTDDGAETDLDLGHYERFLDRPLSQAEQHHDRPHLLERHHEGTARRVPRLDGAGDPAHHRRDQAGHQAHRAGQRRGDRRDRRHGRRHRVAAVPRGHPPVPSARSARRTRCSCT